MGRCSPCGFCRNLYPSPARHMATGPQKPRSTGTRTDPYTFTRCERHHRAVQSGTRRFYLCQSRQGLHRCPSLLPLSEPQAGRARVCPHPAGRTFQPATESIPHSAGTPHHLHGKSPVADIGRQNFAPVARTPGRLAGEELRQRLHRILQRSQMRCFCPDHFHFQAVRQEDVPSSANGRN